MPDALISSTTSPGPGSGSGNSMNSRVRSPAKTTARMRLLPLDLSLGSKSGTVRRDFKSREWPAPMRITAIHDIVVPIASSISNAYIDFSAMTASVVAVVTDIRCDGRPVVGFGFNSNGRYAPQGLLRERFIPRLLAANPEEIQDGAGLIDPAKAWAQMMQNEK